MMRSTALAIAAIASFVLPANAELSLKARYKCVMISGDGAGELATGFASNCVYHTLKERAFNWRGIGPTQLTYKGHRSLTRKERQVPMYWLNNIDQLDTQYISIDFDLAAFLIEASNAPDSYALTSNVRGEGRVDLVFVSADGVQRAVHLPDGQANHEPYGLWFTE